MVIQSLQRLAQQAVPPGNGLILPFIAHSPQQLRRVPFAQPCLMLVLQGVKQLHAQATQDLSPGQMLLVPAGCELNFTNQPDITGFYQAWLVAFTPEDLQSLGHGPVQRETSQLVVDDLLLSLFQQWLLLQRHGPRVAHLLPLRRRELVQHLCALGCAPQLRSGLLLDWSGRVQNLLRGDLSRDWQLSDICAHLAVSESSLRRKLKQEARSFRELLEEVRLGHGLNLLQTRQLSVQQVADACGYQSASRFSERFRLRFGMSPSDLRHSRTAVSGAKLAL